jgi:hypothetical protein
MRIDSGVSERSSLKKRKINYSQNFNGQNQNPFETSQQYVPNIVRAPNTASVERMLKENENLKKEILDSM